MTPAATARAQRRVETRETVRLLALAAAALTAATDLLARRLAEVPPQLAAATRGGAPARRARTLPGGPTRGRTTP